MEVAVEKRVAHAEQQRARRGKARHRAVIRRRMVTPRAHQTR